MAFAKAANGGITGHRADGGESMGEKAGFGAHASSRGRSLASGMAAANYDYV
jgi:hypothetical protein